MCFLAYRFRYGLDLEEGLARLPAGVLPSRFSKSLHSSPVPTSQDIVKEATPPVYVTVSSQPSTSYPDSSTTAAATTTTRRNLPKETIQAPDDLWGDSDWTLEDFPTTSADASQQVVVGAGAAETPAGTVVVEKNTERLSDAPPPPPPPPSSDILMSVPSLLIGTLPALLLSDMRSHVQRLMYFIKGLAHQAANWLGLTN